LIEVLCVNIKTNSQGLLVALFSKQRKLIGFLETIQNHYSTNLNKYFVFFFNVVDVSCDG
jgi:hypothetical protein